MPKPTLSLDLCLSRNRFSAFLVGDFCDSCREIRASSAGIEKLSCGLCRFAAFSPHSGMFESARIASSPGPIEDTKLTRDIRFDHFDLLFGDSSLVIGRFNVICGGDSRLLEGAGISTALSASFSTSLWSS